MNKKTFAIFGSLVIISLVLSIQNGPLYVEAKKPVHLGDPHDYFPGPPIPSCSAGSHQGPPDDPIKGCKETHK